MEDNPFKSLDWLRRDHKKTHIFHRDLEHKRKRFKRHAELLLESKRVICLKWYKNFLILSILGGYWLSTYLFFFDLRLYGPSTKFGIAFWVFDLIYFLHFLDNLCCGENGLFQYNFEPEGERSYRFVFQATKCLMYARSCVYILSLVPIEYFMYPFDKYPAGSPWAFALLRMHRIYRFWFLFETFQSEKERSFITMPGNLWRVAWYYLALIAFLIYHGMACIWYWQICFPVVNNEKPKCTSTWLERYMEFMYIDDRNGTHPFFAGATLSKPEPFGLYTGIFLLCFMTFRNPGTLYLPPNSHLDMLTSILVVALTFLSQCAVLLLFINLTRIADLPRMMFENQVRGCTSIIQHLGFDYHTRIQVFKFLSIIWHRRKVFTDDGLKVTFPQVLLEEIYTEKAFPLFYASELLQTLTRSALEALAPRVQFKTYYAGDFIIFPGVIDYNMVFLTSGKADIYDSMDDHVVMHLTSGSLLGESNIICPSFRTVAVKAATFCETMTLSWKDVNQVLKAEPEARRYMHIILLRRLKFAEAHTRQQDRYSLHSVKSSSIRVQESSHSQSQRMESSSIHSINTLQSGNSKATSARIKSMALLLQDYPTEYREALQYAFHSPLTHKRYVMPERINEYDFEAAVDLEPRYRNEASNANYRFTEEVWTKPQISLRKGMVIATDTVFASIWITLIFFYTIWHTHWFMESILYSTTGTGVLVINIVTEILFSADAFLHLIVFRHPMELNSRTDVLDFTHHLYNELRGWRAWFDILAVIPFWYLSGEIPAPQMWRMNKLLKFFTIMCKATELVEDVNFSLLKTRMYRHVANIVTFILFMGFFATFCQCIYSGYVECEIKFSETVLKRYNLNDPNANKLGIFMYWALCAVFGITFRDVHGFSEELVFFIAAYVIAYYLQTYCWGEIIATSVGLSDIQNRYLLARTWFKDLLQKCFTEPELVEVVDNYILNQWRYWRGLNYTVERSKTTHFPTIHYHVYDEIMVEVAYHSLSHFAIFKLMEPAYIRELCKKARVNMVKANTVIVPYGGFVRHAYILRRGVVEVTIVPGIGPPISSKYTAGECFLGFGEMALRIPSLVQIKTCSDVELVMFEEAAINEAFFNSKNYHNVWKHVREDQDWKRAYRKILVPHGSEPVLKYIDVSEMHKPVFIPALHVFFGPSFEERKQGLKNRKWETPWKTASWWVKIFKPCTLRCTINPTKWFQHYWTMIRILTIYTILFWVPIAEAFPCLKHRFLFVTQFCDAVSILDMLLRFYTAYYEPRYYFHPAQTIRNYLCSTFITDLIGGPIFYYLMELIFQTFTSLEFQRSPVSFILRLNRLLMAYHLYGYEKHLERKVSELSNAKKLLQILPILLFHGHLMACLLSVISCPSVALNCNMRSERCERNSWIFKGLRFNSLSGPTLNRNANLTDVELYITAFYHETTTSAGSPLGDYAPVNAIERVFISCTVFVYIIMTAYVLGRLIGIKPLYYLRMATFQKNVDHLMDFLIEENVDYHTKMSVLGYYEQLWQKCSATSANDLKMTMLPSLIEDVRMHFNQPIWSRAMEFQGASTGFLRAICYIMRPMFFPMNQVIFRETDIADDILIIKSGIVLCSKYGYIGTRVRDVGVLGTFEDFYDYTCVAMDQLQILALSKKDLEPLENVFPNDIAHLKEIMKEDRTIPYDNQGLGSGDHSGMPVSKKELPQTLKNPDIVDGKASHNLMLSGYKRRLDPALESPLYVGFQPLAEFEKDHCKSSDVNYEDLYKGFVLSQDSLLYCFLEALYFVGALGSCIILPYQIGFKNFTLHAFLISYACDGIYIAKMIVSFFVHSINPEGSIVGDWGDIIAKYFGHFKGFTFDLVTTFPFELLTLPQFTLGLHYEYLSYVISLARVNRLLRVIHVWYFFTPREYNSGYGVPLTRMKSIRIAIMSFLYLHWMASLLQTWTLIDCPPTTCSNFTQYLDEVKNRTWVGTKTGDNEHMRVPYIYTMYFIVGAFCGINYGDVRAVNKFEMLFITCLAMSSRAWLAMTIADVVNSMHVYLEPAQQFRLAVTESLSGYKQDGVTDYTLARVGAHLEKVWLYFRGLVEPKLLLDLPMCLKMDLMLHIYDEIFAKSYLFYNVPENFKRLFSVKLHRMVVFQGEYIVKSGQIGDKMYFIKCGTVIFRKRGPPTENQEEGELLEDRVSFPRHFGDGNALVGMKKYTCSYIAETDVELAVISHDELDKVFFPHFQDIWKVVMRRYEKVQNQTLGVPFSGHFKLSDSDVDSSEDENVEETPDGAHDPANGSRSTSILRKESKSSVKDSNFTKVKNIFYHEST